MKGKPYSEKEEQMKNWLIDIWTWLSSLILGHPSTPAKEPKVIPFPGSPAIPQPAKRKVTYVAYGPMVDVVAQPLFAPHEVLRAAEACFGPLSEKAKHNIGYMVDAMHDKNMWRQSHVAYTLATVYHETAGTFEPVEEAYWLDDPESYRRKLSYYPWYGRGYSQLTWKSNYKYMSEVTGYDLLKYPDLALAPIVAAEILIHGMLFGFYPGGPTLEWYLNENKTDFYNARRVVNGTDKAHLILGYAQCAYKSLQPEI